MVYFPRLTFKTGINPSKLSSFPVNGQYTGTQKLLLARTRIFGEMIGGNMKSGMDEWHRPRVGRMLTYGIRFDLFNIHRFAPFPKDHAQIQFYRTRKALREEEKLKKQARKVKK